MTLCMTADVMSEYGINYDDYDPYGYHIKQWSDLRHIFTSNRMFLKKRALFSFMLSFIFYLIYLSHVILQLFSIYLQGSAAKEGGRNNAQRKRREREKVSECRLFSPVMYCKTQGNEKENSTMVLSGFQWHGQLLIFSWGREYGVLFDWQVNWFDF